MDEAAVDPHEWLRALAGRLALPEPGPDEVADLLSLAGTAAHAAERWVAPVSTWLVARADLEPAAARSLVERLAAELAGERPADGPGASQ